MAMLIGFLVLAFGALIWVLDWSVSGVDASTIGVILIVLGGMIVLASRLISEKAAIDRRMTDEPRDWLTAEGVEDAPEDDAEPLQRRPPDHPPFR
jgi:hypothetical protein